MTRLKPILFQYDDFAQRRFLVNWPTTLVQAPSDRFQIRAGFLAVLPKPLFIVADDWRCNPEARKKTALRELRNTAWTRLLNG